jgi:hypothetical protein
VGRERERDLAREQSSKKVIIKGLKNAGGRLGGSGRPLFSKPSGQQR